MRRRTTLVAFALALPSLAACFDLFHATDDIQNLCALDASASDACGSAADAAPPPDSAGDEPDAAPPVYNTADFCSNDSPTAYAAAEKACQLLGACGGPIGNSQFARCMPRAIMAYDCSAAPERKVVGATRAFWKCVADANSCGELRACAALPAVGCDVNAGAYSVCAGSARLACTPSDGGVIALVEPCAGWGQACATNANGNAICAGASDAGACTTDGCNGSKLTSCSSLGDNVGVDCAGFGAGQCVTVSGSPACASTGAPCTPSTAVTCKNGVASACISGQLEHVDCTKVTAGNGVCHNVSAASPSWAVAQVCLPDKTCAPERCDGNILKSCAEGLAFETLCPKGCVAGIVTPDSDSPHAACKP